MNPSIAEEYKPYLYLDRGELQMPVDFRDVIFKRNIVVPDSTITSVTQPHPSGKGVRIFYFMLFLRDDGVKVMRWTVDDHDWDIEMIIIDIDEKGIVSGVCYTPHGQENNFWIKHRDDLGRILAEGKHPRVFISKGKHATMPVPLMRRWGGVANDVCRPPRTKLDLPIVECPDSLWRPYTYRLGSVELSSIRQRVNFNYNKAPAIRLADVKNFAIFPVATVLKQAKRSITRWFK